MSVIGTMDLMRVMRVMRIMNGKFLVRAISYMGVAAK